MHTAHPSFFILRSLISALKVEKARMHIVHSSFFFILQLIAFSTISELKGVYCNTSSQKTDIAAKNTNDSSKLNL